MWSGKRGLSSGEQNGAQERTWLIICSRRVEVGITWLFALVRHQAHRSCRAVEKTGVQECWRVTGPFLPLDPLRSSHRNKSEKDTFLDYFRHPAPCPKQTVSTRPAPGWWLPPEPSLAPCSVFPPLHLLMSVASRCLLSLHPPESLPRFMELLLCVEHLALHRGKKNEYNKLPKWKLLWKNLFF